MNFHKTVFLGAFAAALSAAAAVDTSNLVGILKVTSSATNTIVAAPWLAVGGATGVRVADLVRTTNLTAGDMLLVPDPSDGKYQAWVLQGNAWEGVAVGEADGGGNSFNVGVAPSDKVLARGQALWLVRQNPTDAQGRAIDFYLYGQYSSTSASNPIAANTYNLLGNPNTTAKTFNADYWDSLKASIGTGDFIVVPNGNNNLQFTWDGTTFVRTYISGINPTTHLPTKEKQESFTIQPGQGFWYVSKGGTPTITW